MLSLKTAMEIGKVMFSFIDNLNEFVQDCTHGKASEWEHRVYLLCERSLYEKFLKETDCVPGRTTIKYEVHIDQPVYFDFGPVRDEIDFLFKQYGITCTKFDLEDVVD